VLIDGDLAVQMCAIVRPKDFYGLANCAIWRAIETLSRRGAAVDPVTVGEALRTAGELDRVGGPTALSALIDAGALPSRAEDLARRVRDLSAQRGIVAVARGICARGEQPQESVSSFVAESLADFAAEAAAADTDSGPVHVGTDLAVVAKDAYSGRDAGARLSTGIWRIDEKVGGLPQQLLTVVGGRPAMGKSSLLLCVADHAAQSGPVLYFSFEDSVRTNQSRLISRRCGVPYFEIDAGAVGEAETGPIRALPEVGELKIWFVTRRSTVDDLFRDAHLFRARIGQPRLIVIDHLGLIATRGRYVPPYEAATLKVKRLAFLGAEIGCPVLLACQLNRGVENRPDKRPRMSDLRDSGQIEEYARMIILLYRDSVYDDAADEHEIEIIVPKNTGGPAGTIRDRCDVRICRIGGQ
jgi:replicative DNA helicase